MMLRMLVCVMHGDGVYDMTGGVVEYAMYDMIDYVIDDMVYDVVDAMNDVMTGDDLCD